MKLTIFGLLAVFFVLGIAGAQQPNTFNASMVINGTAGPPYPITGVNLPRGLPQNVVISSSTLNAPFVLFGAPFMYANGGYSVLGGELLDVNIGVGGFILLDGIANPTVFNTGATGAFNSSVTLSSTATLGTQAAFQCLVADVAAPFGSRLTAASEVTVTQGLTVLTLSTPNNGGALVNLNSYGLSFPFYANLWTNMFVNTDGNVTFGSQSGDFTPTPSEFRTQQPRIAPMWTDLDQSYFGASITATIDQSGLFGFPTVTVDWIQMAEWSNTGARHTFQLVMNLVSGDITINHDPFNVAMIYDELMGIGPGQNLLPPSGMWAATQDLSTLPANPYLGAPNEAFWEWFGLVGMTYYTQGYNNPWDMTGRTNNFLAVGVGASGGYYYAN